MPVTDSGSAVERLATCSCGQLQLRASGEPVRISVCHCLACQRRTGSVFGVQARFPLDRVSVHGYSKAYLRIADSGNQLTGHFCPECGATVYLTLDIEPDLVGVPVGAFADPCFPPPPASIYEQHRHPWVGLPEDIEHWR
ncbi:GFA family protein [Microbulbifer guangxiensis]|uniref:GFA family protein n=1 Tax=Microbulbifer guangxiensis TaxID=2904249 RepID=UPI001F15FC17|nr:GFA family protein [Microbulbifer guangxiensis]